MSDEQHDDQVTSPEHAEESTNTADVREAIERARDAQPADVDETTVIEPSGLSAEEHASTSTEALEIQQQEAMPSAAPEEPVVTEPAAATTPATPAATPTPAPMTISPDHPMAPLYFQHPNPPALKSNRLAGVLIALLATLAFAVVYAGLIAIWRAPDYPPSRFLSEGILPYLTSLGFILPAIAFFIGMVVLVLIFNRAGWWVYAVLGLIVAVLVWGTAGAGFSLSPQLAGSDELAVQYGLSLKNITSFALTIPGIMAALAAREVAVWFGAWIGARGRKMKRLNAEAMDEYETKLRELQVPHTPPAA